MKNTSKMITNSSAAGNLYQALMGPNSNNKTPEILNLDCQTSSNCFEKKRGCYTMVNMPRPNYLGPVAGIEFEMSSFSGYNCRISQFKHLLCYLCSIMNKISAHVICIDCCLQQQKFVFVQACSHTSFVPKTSRVVEPCKKGHFCFILTFPRI